MGREEIMRWGEREIPKGQQTCKKCGRPQYFEFVVKDWIWNILPKYWRNRVLCVDCFIEEMDLALDKGLKLSLDDFEFIAFVGDKLRATIRDSRVP